MRALFFFYSFTTFVFLLSILCFSHSVMPPKPITRSNTAATTHVSLEDIPRLIAESESRLLSRLDAISERLQTIESSLEKVKKNMGSFVAELDGVKDLLTVEQKELQSIKESSQTSYMAHGGLIAELPTALAHSRKLENATETASHEVIIIGLPEDVDDLQDFSISSSEQLNCFPPSSARRLGRVGSLPRLVRLSFTNPFDARTYRLSAMKAYRENKISFWARPSFPVELHIWKFIRIAGKWTTNSNWCETSVAAARNDEEQGN